ncbi:restriction endonuclease subunit S [Ruminococcus sp. AF31-8BH]|uniref:restriction endonuclease subunit S n=1 Tax=Ruminococcus sp. AF31-8BH TaxID=2293174 RepID=UPI000E4F1E9D|nr:restriction endonuclease subunit S [Ruminococcus sp. AF31-8BH]RGF74541.1 restriction endonuclease subunit S [Ruminococcus sp. AF31-8BH]
MKSEWTTYTVQELIDKEMLEPPMDGNHGEIHPKTTDYVKSGVPFIMANNLINGKVDYSNCAFITNKQASTLKKGFAHPGDVLLTHKATIGRTALVGTEYDTIILTPQVTYYRVKRGISNLYLKYYFDSNEFQQTLANWAGSGSTRAYLGITAQRKLPVVLPPLEIQTKIAEFGRILDDKIELNNKVNENLYEQMLSIFNNARRTSAWNKHKLGDVLIFFDNLRKPLSSIQREKMAHIYPYYGAASIVDYVEDYLFDGTYILISEDGANVIDSFGHPLTQYTYGKFWVNNHAHIVKGSNGYSEALVYAMLGTLNMQSIVTGAAQPKINQANLRNFEAVLPESEEAQVLSELLNPMLQQMLHHDQENEKLSELRDILLPQLMSGALDVSAIDL